MLVKVTLLPVSMVVWEAGEAVRVTVGSALTVTVIEFEDDTALPRESVTMEVTIYSPVSEKVITFPVTE